MKAINRFFSQVGIVMMGILSIIFDLILLAIVLTVIGVVLAVIGMVFIFYGTYVLVGKALRGVR